MMIYGYTNKLLKKEEEKKEDIKQKGWLALNVYTKARNVCLNNFY